MWRKLTEDDLVATLSRDEIDTYRRDFNIDPVPALLADTAAWVRGYVRSNGNVRMDPDELSIPSSCVSPAMDYVAIKIMKRINIEPVKIRKEAYQSAVNFFDQISQRKITPESYGNDSTSITGGPAIDIVSTSRNRTNKIEGF